MMTDYSLEHCKGCRHCVTHVEFAIEGDDLGLLVGKMHTSDPIILRAPLYCWSPSRTSSTEPTPSTPTIRRFEGKKVAVITVAAQSGFSSHEPEDRVSEIFKVAPWVLN